MASPEAVAAGVLAVCGLTGQAFTWQELVKRLGERQALHIEVRYDDLDYLSSVGEAPTGFCIAVSEQLLIFLRSGMQPLHEDAVVYHELGHFFCGHLKQSPGGMLCDSNPEVEAEAEGFAKALLLAATRGKHPRETRVGQAVRTYRALFAAVMSRLVPSFFAAR